jgi:hypothetical protein
VLGVEALAAESMVFEIGTGTAGEGSIVAQEAEMLSVDLESQVRMSINRSNNLVLKGAQVWRMNMVRIQTSTTSSKSFDGTPQEGTIVCSRQGQG